jgi:hypothetical protein
MLHYTLQHNNMIFSMVFFRGNSSYAENCASNCTGRVRGTGGAEAYITSMAGILPAPYDTWMYSSYLRDKKKNPVSRGIA